MPRDAPGDQSRFSAQRRRHTSMSQRVDLFLANHFDGGAWKIQNRRECGLPTAGF